MHTSTKHRFRLSEQGQRGEVHGRAAVPHCEHQQAVSGLPGDEGVPEQSPEVVIYTGKQQGTHGLAEAVVKPTNRFQLLQCVVT